MNRSYQRQIVAFVTPAPVAGAIVPKPLSVRKLIRARRTRFIRLLPSVVIATSRSRCSSETLKPTPVRIFLPLVCPAPLLQALWRPMG